ncbi:MAG TPA: hypothetical protein VGG19_13900 [Tepidisphaeraceae bacterium]|jgi:flagellar biosynthesis/type III secretory pathway M-ring protein FliF/YscJ
MNLVRTQFDRIQAQLLALTPSQKMLTASLLTIMVMTLFYWVHYAASPEYLPVLDQSLSTEDVGRISNYLRSHDYDVKVSSDRVLVPAERQMQAVAELTEAQQMPQNITDGFDSMVKIMNPFDADDKSDEMWKHATEITVSGIISRWQGVTNASVVIDKTMKQGMSIEDSIQPSAAVNITTRDPGKTDRHLADSAQRFLTGAVAGLDAANVHVIINGIAINTDTGDGLGAASQGLDMARDQEKYLSGKIKEALAYMNAPVLAEVTCDVDTQSISKEQTEIDTKNSLYKPLKEETTSDEINSGQAASAEPGLGANIQANVGESGGAKTNSTKTMENNEFTVLPSQTLTKTTQTPGKITPRAATVQIPRTYFVACYKQENPSAKDPDASAIQSIIDTQTPVIKGAIRGCTGLTDDAISIGFYDPISPEISPETVAIAGGQTSTVTALLSGHLKDIAVAALAVISLFMVSMMVRKGTPQPIVHAVQEKSEPQSLEAGELVAGEASEGNATLDGMELDDDAVKTQQMIGQVSQMVKENPDGAANLVKRWLNHA